MRFFVDMDGTLAKWNNVEFEQLFEQGYYRNLEPNEDILIDLNWLIEQGEDVYILSCVLPESKYALDEKKEWLKQYVPALSEEKYIFVPYGENKADYLKEHYSPITNKDYLIDDYTKNLIEWKEYGGMGVKYINGINHTRGTWDGLMINGDKFYDPLYVDEEDLDINEITSRRDRLAHLAICEKIKEHGIGMIATCSFFRGFHSDFLCMYNSELYNIDPVQCLHNDEYISLTDTVFSIRNELSNSKPINISSYIITLKRRYYSEHYPTLSKCRSFDKLINQLDSNTLDNLEYSVYLWINTDKIIMNKDTTLQVSKEVDSSRILEKGLHWFEGILNINEFLEELGVITEITEDYNNELEQDEPDITEDY